VPFGFTFFGLEESDMMEKGKKLTGTGDHQINQSPFGKKPLKNFSKTNPNLFFGCLFIKD